MAGNHGARSQSAKFQLVKTNKKKLEPFVMLHIFIPEASNVKAGESLHFKQALSTEKITEQSCTGIEGNYGKHKAS